MAINGEIEKLERRWQDNPLGLTFAPLAEAYRKSGEPAKALALLEAGLGQHPNYVPAHIVRGRCHLDNGAHAEAEQAFLRVAELDPENAIALKGLADLAEQDGNFTAAIARLEALLEVDRNNEEARAQLDRLREPAASTEDPEPGYPGDPSEPEPIPVHGMEFQFNDDALALSPDQEPMSEIILHDLGEALPSAEAAQGQELVAGPDPAAAQGIEGIEAETRDFSEVNSEALAEEPAAPEPSEERFPAPEPELAAEQEAEAPPQAESVPVPDDVPGPAAEPAPESEGPLDTELVITETMAEIFLRQGHRELALAVYTQLAQRDPASQRIAAACARLRAELAPPSHSPSVADAPAADPPAPATPPPPPPRYDAATTGGRSVSELFAAVLAAERPNVSATIHPPAFEARHPSGEPTRPASETLSLSAIFGEDGPPPGPAGAPEESSPSEPSFEQFFTSAPPPSAGEGSTSEIQLPKPPESETPALSSMAPEDLEQFNAWLRGLKR